MKFVTYIALLKIKKNKHLLQIILKNKKTRIKITLNNS